MISGKFLFYDGVFENAPSRSPDDSRSKISAETLAKSTDTAVVFDLCQPSAGAGPSSGGAAMTKHAAFSRIVEHCQLKPEN
jgi:hypothetical protein